MVDYLNRTDLLDRAKLSQLASIVGPEKMRGIFDLIPKTINQLTENLHVAASTDPVDLQALAEHAHSLKGVSGNMGLEALHLLCGDLLSDLHGGRPSEAVAKVEIAKELGRRTLAEAAAQRKLLC